MTTNEREEIERYIAELTEDLNKTAALIAGLKRILDVELEKKLKNE